MNIILSPHFDDAVLSLGGLLAQEGRDTLVATFFAGTPSTPLVRRWDTKCGFRDSDEAMRSRAEENTKSLSTFGVAPDRIRNYAYIDAEYRRTDDSREIPDPELESSLVREINALLQEFNSDSIRVFAPGLEMHPDHTLVKTAALAVARALPLGSTVQFFFYQDIPYALKILKEERSHSILNMFTYKNPRTWDYFSLEHHITNGAFAISAYPIPLTRADMEKKSAGIALYTSQAGHLGDHMLERLEQFSAAQSRFFSLSTPYCEMTYMPAV